MNFLDRALLTLAGFCLSAIFAIFFSEGLRPNYTNHNILQEGETRVEISPSKESKPDDNMIVYSQEIDEVINKYFYSLKQRPEINEEEKRLVDDVFSEKEEYKNPGKKDRPPQKTPDDQLIIKHIVKKGESLWRLSSKYHVPLYTIISANPTKEKQLIHPGDELQIPTKQGIIYKIKKGDTLSRISRKHKVPIKKIQSLNRSKLIKIYPGQKVFLPNAKPVPKTRYVYKNRFLWPIQGRITSRYGWRKHPVHNSRHFHKGIDIGARLGTKIRAVAKGVVIHAQKSGGYGNLVILRHKDNYLSVYAHCSKIFVRRGRVVKRGQTIARVGSSGLATGSHLHFEVKRYKKNMNPISALKKKIKIPAG